MACSIHRLLVIGCLCLGTAEAVSRLEFKSTDRNLASCTISGAASSIAALGSDCDIKLDSGASIQSNANAIAALRKDIDAVQSQIGLDLSSKLQRILACENGKWENDAFTSLADRCLPCHAECLHCSGPNHDHCTGCDGSKIFHDSKCYEPCTCESGTPFAGAACVKVFEQSGDRHQCAACAAGHFLHGNRCHKPCSCTNGQPQPDGAKCAGARSSGGGMEQCASCTDGFRLEGGMCVANWIQVFSESRGSGNGAQYDNSDERTLNFGHRLPPWAMQGKYWVRLDYNGGQRTQFLVPAGRSIFNQAFSGSQIDDIPISHVTSSFGSIGSSSTFCHACRKNGYKWGDTCWGIVATGHRQCGCNSGSWAGVGIYYGGYKRPNTCGGQGGGFVGHKHHGQAKGSQGSVGLTMYIKREG